jgi:hypothetical protein
MAFAFEKLEVYQKSVAFGDVVCASTRSFARGYYFLADPLNRAALSIATNIARAIDGSPRLTVAMSLYSHQAGYAQVGEALS